jgi:hypothetical protein
MEVFFVEECVTEQVEWSFLMCSGNRSKRYTQKFKHDRDGEFSNSHYPTARHSKYGVPSRKLILLDADNGIVMHVSLCAVITFLSIVIWWSAWIPLALGGLAVTAYVIGYRVVISEDEHKPKRKNDEFEAVSHNII